MEPLFDTEHVTENSESNTGDGQPPVPSPPALPQEGGFLQTVGLSPGSALCAIGVDLLLSASDLASAGLLVPFSLLAAGAIGYVTYRMQRNWGDGHENAMMKAVLVGLVTAIPVPITPLLAGPAGLAGFIKNLRDK